MLDQIKKGKKIGRNEPCFVDLEKNLNIVVVLYKFN
jgi:hypothetical protein